jgi:hypothetical protein
MVNSGGVIGTREAIMFCPQCKAEYRVGFTRCSDCGVELVDLLPAEPVEPAEPLDPRRDLDSSLEFVVIRTYANQLAADIARAMLESAGIEPMLRPETYYGRIDLLVKSDDARDADDILSADSTGSQTMSSEDSE